MKPLSSRHLLCLSLAAWGVVLAAAGFGLRREQRAAHRAETALALKLQERAWLADQTPAPGVENEEAIAAALAEAHRAFAAAAMALRPGEASPGEEPAPAQTLDAYFSIARLVERQRAAARAAQVALRPDERFGFAAFAHEGPATEALAQVHRQMTVGATLVAHLIEAHPIALLAVRREAVEQGATASRQGEDYFTLDPALSLRQPGAVETVAFRVEFSGQTGTLRDFLTALARQPQPFLVRSVEVEPLPGHAGEEAHGTEEARAAAPLVRQHAAKFAVVVESVRWTGVSPKAMP